MSMRMVLSVVALAGRGVLPALASCVAVIPPVPR